MSDEPKFNIKYLFGRVELDSKTAIEPNGDLVFYGRRREYDETGRLTYTSPWEAGLRMFYPPEPKSWLATLWHRLTKPTTPQDAQP